jgi:hypothetical protein
MGLLMFKAISDELICPYVYCDRLSFVYNNSASEFMRKFALFTGATADIVKKTERSGGG